MAGGSVIEAGEKPLFSLVDVSGGTARVMAALRRRRAV